MINLLFLIFQFQHAIVTVTDQSVCLVTERANVNVVKILMVRDANNVKKVITTSPPAKVVIVIQLV